MSRFKIRTKLVIAALAVVASTVMGAVQPATAAYTRPVSCAGALDDYGGLNATFTFKYGADYTDDDLTANEKNQLSHASYYVSVYC